MHRAGSGVSKFLLGSWINSCLADPFFSRPDARPWVDKDKVTGYQFDAVARAVNRVAAKSSEATCRVRWRLDDNQSLALRAPFQATFRQAFAQE